MLYLLKDPFASQLAAEMVYLWVQQIAVTSIKVTEQLLEYDYI